MSDVTFWFALVGLTSISLLSSTIALGLSSLNRYQLKRSAQLGDKRAKIVYPLYSLGNQLLVCMMLFSVAANATLVALLGQKITTAFAVTMAALIVLALGQIVPMLYLRKHTVSITAVCAPVLKRLMVLTKPIVVPLAKLLDRAQSREVKTFYSKEELLKSFDDHKLVEDGDITANDLRMIRAISLFGDKKIRDVMTPRRVVQVVARDDEVGPVLMDELHKSGYSRFPVVADSKHFNFVGTLYLRDLVGETSARKVKDLMSPDVLYTHEESLLSSALRAFLKTHHHLFVVVNNFEEFVGVLSIEDVLEEMIGSEIVDEFDAHEDLRAVAQSLAQKERLKREKQTNSVK